jgi:hypothetical protein|eukprot:COSAG06_NODE_1192_length_10329_cov_2.847703_7_plen_73_part_00
MPLRFKLGGRPIPSRYGCEYASFQLHLPPEHCETGGMYRNDTAFLELSARRVADIQRVCFEEGVNFYVVSCA